MKKMFKEKHSIKIRKLNLNKLKAMIIPYHIWKTNRKLFLTVNPKTNVNWNVLIVYGYNAFFNDSHMFYLFAIVYFQIYKILVI